MVTGSPAPFLLVMVVVVAIVLGSSMGTSGKDEMIRLDNQSDVLISDQQLTDTWTMQVQGTPLLRTDSVANTISTHDSQGMHKRQYSLMLHVDVSVTNG